jgi:hypothetical protein
VEEKIPWEKKKLCVIEVAGQCTQATFIDFRDRNLRLLMTRNFL